MLVASLMLRMPIVRAFSVQFSMLMLADISTRASGSAVAGSKRLGGASCSTVAVVAVVADMAAVAAGGSGEGTAYRQGGVVRVLQEDATASRISIPAPTL